jgi:anti-anti-sigma factor
MPPETGYTSEPLDRDTSLVTVAGEVTFSNVTGLARELESALERALKLIVDLTSVTFIDSSGLSVLLTASTNARSRGGAVALVLAQGEPPAIFRFRGVDRLLALYPSREAALAGLS